MPKNMKTRKGKDGFNYPYTSPDLVIDGNGKSATTKFNELEDKMKKVGSTSIDDTNTTTDKTWSSSKIDSQFKDVANKTIIEDNKLYLVKSDGTKVDNGTILPEIGDSKNTIEKYNNIKSTNYSMLKGLTPTNDTEGNYFNCHGLGILYYNGVYYAYGESKTGKTSNGFIPTTGVNCYSSTDLINWKFENKVLKPNTADTDSPIHTSKVIERPKVIYNEKNNNFVMIFHADDKSYSFASIGIAVSNSPTGDFTFLKTTRAGLDNSTARDLTVFIDDDKSAYVFVSRDNNNSLYCHKLNDDYTDFTSNYSIVIQNGNREAPAVFKYKNEYYIMTSGLTGWSPNPTKIYKSNTITGTYIDQDKTCLNDSNSNSYGGQPTFVLPINKDEYGYEFIAMFDKWDSGDLEKSKYMWLPLFIQDGKFHVDNVNVNQFKILREALSINVVDSNNFFYGKSYEYSLDYLYKLIINSGATLYTVTNNLTNCTNSTTVATIKENDAYSATITADSGCTLTNVTVTMGGIDITNTAVSNGVITINSVTGNIIITATAIIVDKNKLVYSLPKTTTFNGRSDYIDTEVQLFDTDKDFTIFLDFINGDGNTSTLNTILHCMEEQSPYYGLSIKPSSKYIKVDYYGNADQDNIIISEPTKLIITHTKNIDNVKLYFKNNVTGVDLSATLPYHSITQNTILGAYQDINGNKGRYWKGTITQCKIWFGILTNDDIVALLN